MTADEVAFAGGVYKNHNPKAYYYLNLKGTSSTGGKGWWTMSPSYFNKNATDYIGFSLVFVINQNNIQVIWR